MSSVLLIGIGSVSAMIIVLAIFSNDIKESQNKLKENVIERRKARLNDLLATKEKDKDFVIQVNKNWFTKRKEKTEHLILKANVKITYYEFLMISVLMGVIGWICGELINNVFVSMVLAVVTFRLPKGYLNFICNSVKKQINEQLEPALSQIIALLPSKKTLINACESCVDTMEDPLKTYFTEFINNINNANRSFEEAIDELAKKIDTKSFYDFARIAIVHYNQGGETMYAFNSIPETMRDVKMIQSEQEAELDSLKLMGYIFVLLTPLSFFYYYFTDPTNFNILVNTFIGKIISGIVLVVTIATVVIIKKISEPVEL